MNRRKQIALLVLLLIACKIGVTGMEFREDGWSFDPSILGFAFAQGEGEKDPANKKMRGVSKKGDSIDITIEMMKTLNKRREELDKREGELVKKEEMLHLVEEGVLAKLDEMNKIKKEIEKLIETRDAKREASLQHLARIYKNMEPNDAASQMEKLDTELAIQVFTRMKSRTSSQILPFLSSKLAKRLSEEVVKRRLIQEPQPKKKR